MGKLYIIAESQNFASRLSRDLRRSGINSEIVHTPETESGCLYSVLVSDKYYDLIEKNKQKYRIKKIIRHGSDG